MANAAKRTAISGTLYVTAKIGEKSVTAPGVMLVQWPDKFRLEAQDPVGGTLVLLVVNGQEFWLYQKESPEILTGQLKHLPPALRTIAAGKDFVRAFLARPPLDEWPAALVEKHSARPKVAPDLGAMRPAKVSWNDRLLEPTEWQQGYAGGASSRVEYEDYASRSGISFPEKIRITHTDPEGKTEASVFSWRDWQPYVPEEKKLFQIPQQQQFGRKIKALH